MRQSPSARLRSAVIQVGLAAGAVMMLLPFAIMLRTAFIPERDVLAGGFGLGNVTLENFVAAWRAADWVGYYRNSVIVTLCTFIAQVVIGLPAAYALARLKFKSKRATFALVLACLVIPPQVTAVPTYVLLSHVGLADTLPGLILPFAASAFGIYLFRQFILTIPGSVFDAARLDGVCGFSMVWRVVLPNVRPALLAFGVFSIVGHWNDLFWPSVMLRTTANATVPYGITLFSGLEQGSRFGAQMAAAVLAVTPLLLAFIFVQKQFVNGIALSAAD